MMFCYQGLIENNFFIITNKDKVPYIIHQMIRPKNLLVGAT